MEVFERCNKEIQSHHRSFHAGWPRISLAMILFSPYASFFTVIFDSSSALAGPLNPAGSYSESRLEQNVFLSTVINSTVINSTVMKSTVINSSFPKKPNREAGAQMNLSAPHSAPNHSAQKAAAAPISSGSGSVSGTRLRIEREARVRSSDYALDAKMQKIMDDRILHPFPSPGVFRLEDFQRLKGFAAANPRPTSVAKTKDILLSSNGKIDRTEFDAIQFQLRPEAELKLRKHVPLTPQEVRFLSGLLLFQRADGCASAIGLFHELSKVKNWGPEANYYLAMCSRRLGLESDFHESAARVIESQDSYYASLILKELNADLPYEFTERLGRALANLVSNKKILNQMSEQTLANISYLLAEYGAATERYKLSLLWAKKVPSSHEKFLAARMIEALSEYQVGSKSQALRIQEEILNDQKIDRAKTEVQALVALNAARMHFQEQNYKSAHQAFLKVNKDHPLWLQSLTELGWAQLLSGDYEGAIGNMYSIQSPFFSKVYKPESYVIRTIGYLNLCQFGDAYRTLTRLEREYRPYLEKIRAFEANKMSSYQAVREFLRSSESVKEIAGLPAQLIREMARHRDFINLQKSVNRQIDERELYLKVDGQVERDLKSARQMVTNARQRIAQLRKNLAEISKNRELEQHRNQWLAQLQKEMNDLNGHFFQVDLHTEARAAMKEYRKHVSSVADGRIRDGQEKLEQILARRMGKLKSELELVLENNELLRYEAFAGSGENIRYQMAGGETSTRVPASVIPKSKALRWDFDGEYWEDEIGHYRSSLKNNCPESNYHRQAALGGDQ